MSNQMNNNRNGNQRMNGNNNRNNNRNNVPRRKPVFRPNVLNEKGEQISLFIPRVAAKTSFEKVSFVFHHYYFGKVKNVDFILKQDKNGNDYKLAYVHFDHFYNSENCCVLLDTIRNYGSDKVNCDKYDRSKMWNVFINTGKKHLAGQAKERLNLDLLRSEVEVDETNLESKPALDPRFEAILMKQKEEYEAKIESLKAAMWSQMNVAERGHGLRHREDVEYEINNEYLESYENHKFAEDQRRIPDTSKTNDDQEDGEINDSY